MFDWIRARRRRRDQAHAAYHKIVEAARTPRIYTEWGVADSFDGRFDSVALHAFLVLRRIRAEGPEWAAFGQALFDLMFKDFDQVLREQGVGDMGVGKRVKQMVEAFYGRVTAYEDALQSGGRDELKAAIKRNLYRDSEIGDDSLQKVCDYILAANDYLAETRIEDIAAGRFGFRAREAERVA